MDKIQPRLSHLTALLRSCILFLTGGRSVKKLCFPKLLTEAEKWLVGQLSHSALEGGGGGGGGGKLIIIIQNQYVLFLSINLNLNYIYTFELKT